MTPPAAPTSAEVLGTWLARLSEPAPDPGGGAAAAVVLAAGAALMSMSAGYAHEGDARADAQAAAENARVRALAAADVDAAHSAGLAEAYHLADDDPSRPALMRERMQAAAASSRDVGEIARALRDPLAALADAVPPLLGADVAVAGRLLAAAVRASAVNLRSNVSSAASAGAGEVELGTLRAAELDLRALADAFDATAAAVTARL
jgi:methenyltetrahydrofolate cyclohydrolase